MRLLTRYAAEAEAELLHPHAGGLGHDEMAELMGQDQEPQPHDGDYHSHDADHSLSHLVPSFGTNALPP